MLARARYAYTRYIREIFFFTDHTYYKHVEIHSGKPVREKDFSQVRYMFHLSGRWRLVNCKFNYTPLAAARWTDEFSRTAYMYTRTLLFPSRRWESGFSIGVYARVMRLFMSDVSKERERRRLQWRRCVCVCTRGNRYVCLQLADDFSMNILRSIDTLEHC